MFGVEVPGGFAFRVQLRPLQQGIGERLQPGLAGDLRLGPKSWEYLRIYDVKDETKAVKLKCKLINVSQ